MSPAPNTLKFDNYVYPLINGTLNIANTNYNLNIPQSFASAVFHQDSKTIGIFRNNSSLRNSNDVLGAAYYSGNLTAYIPSTTLNATSLNTHNQTLTIYYGGNTYTGTVDTSSNISYKVTNTDTSSDASGYFSATLFDATHGGQFVIYSNGFTYQPSTGSNIVPDATGGTLGGTVTIPLINTNPSLTRVHAVSISSYVTYVDTIQLA
jgi:hypothetical protein